LRVRDDGDGVAPTLRAQLFQRYAGDDAGGHGLGLSIAHWIASAHDGELELERDEDRGASFVARLPKLG